MPDSKPNILFIMADDIGWLNDSCYNHGIMGYRTPNIDGIAKDGAMFTDFYGQQSCTAGRAASLLDNRRSVAASLRSACPVRSLA
jgi:arylsulfatase